MFSIIRFDRYNVESVFLSSDKVWGNGLLIRTMLFDGFILLKAFVTRADITEGIKLRTEFFSRIASN